MTSKRISFTGADMDVQAVGRNNLSISINADIDTIFSELSIKEIVDNCDVDDLLEHIGAEKAKDYFDLVDAY